MKSRFISLYRENPEDPYIWLVLTLKFPMAGSPVLLALLGAAGLGVPFSLESVPWLEADLAVWDMVE